MIFNPMMISACIVTGAFLAWAVSQVHIKRVIVDVNDESCPSEVKHPGAKWLTDYLESVEMFNNRLDKSAENVKTNKDPLRSMEMMIAILTGKNLISQNLKKIEKISVRKADRIYRKYGSANATTEAVFGSFVEDFLFTTFILDAFEAGEDFEDQASIFENAKKRAHEIRIRNAA